MKPAHSIKIINLIRCDQVLNSIMVASVAVRVGARVLQAAYLAVTKAFSEKTFVHTLV